METNQEASVDFAKVESFAGQVFADMSASISSAMTSLGHRMGLFKAMADGRPLVAEELANRTGTHGRYVQEWLNSQAASGYLIYDPGNQTYQLPAEHAMVLAMEESPAFMAAGFDVMASAWLVGERLEEAFRTGEGIGWHEQSHRLFHATEAFFRNGYRQHLASEWIPAFEGMKARLERGGKVADLGCGHGASTIVMAQAFPNSMFYGFDYHAESIEVARKRAAEAGVSDRVTFQVASAQNFPGQGYDLICIMDAFHDMGDPADAARQARAALAPDGALMLVEPFANDQIEGNLNPVGRLFYSASTAFCVPNSLAQEGRAGLGAQAGMARLTGMLEKSGFQTVRKAMQTPFNLIIEARG